jgi:hypothetical protein
LHNKSQPSNKQEETIVKETSEYIEFTGSELSGVDLVKELHEDEYLEDHCVEVGLVGWCTDLHRCAWVRCYVGLVDIEWSCLGKGKSEDILSKE